MAGSAISGRMRVMTATTSGSQCAGCTSVTWPDWTCLSKETAWSAPCSSADAGINHYNHLRNSSLPCWMSAAETGSCVALNCRILSIASWRRCCCFFSSIAYCINRVKIALLFSFSNSWLNSCLMSSGTLKFTVAMMSLGCWNIQQYEMVQDAIHRASIAQCSPQVPDQPQI